MMAGLEPGSPVHDGSVQAPGREPELIALRLEEYRALRAEMTQRVTGQLQMVGLTGVAAAFVVSGGVTFTSAGPYVGGVFLVFVLFVWRMNSRMIRRIS